MAVDDKVVAISFEASKFEQGVNTAISALEKLKASLHFPSAGKGLDDINTAAKKVDLGHIAKGVDDIKGKLSALSVAALAVFANIAQKAVSAGARFVKAFTLDPIKAGFQEYSTNLQAVQTILANTQAAGTKLKDVNAALKELNTYSDKTIYNFSQMAKNIGTFTAAGVDLKTATGAIKGIANLAALSGSNAEQASTAMYQLSQAISAGRVSLQDWNSVVNAGMGGTVFQRALAETAQAMGTLKDGTVKLVGPMKNVQIAGESFRQSLQAGPGKASWLTSKVLTQTLKQFTGDLSNAELAAMGFNKAQIASIQQTAKTAMHAATEVKTISQVFDVAKETAGSGWAQTFQIIFGNFQEAKTTFTALSNAINGFINTNAAARNKVLADWKALGGRAVLIDAIKTAFHNLGLVIAPIKDAFRDIFPATTGKNLYDLTVRLKQFADALKPSQETVDGLRRTFRGLFALLDIGKQVIGGIFTFFGKLFGAVHEGQGSFLNLTGGIGDFIVSLDKALKKSDGINKFFSGLGEILAVPIKLLKELAGALGDLFGGFSSGGFSGQMGAMTQSMTPFQRVLEAVSRAWDNFVNSVQKSGVLQSALAGLVKLVQDIGPALSNAISGMNFEAILQVIRTGLFGGLVLMLKQFFGKGSLLEQVSKGFAGGIISNISGSFKALEGSMVAMQQNIKAKTLKEIAIAIALLTASVVALSFVDPTKLNAALVAIGAMGGMLIGAMAALDKVSKSAGFIKLPIIGASLILFAGAIDTLVLAVLALSRLDWEGLLKGLTGVGALLAGLAVAVKPLSASSAGMIRAGLGIGAIALAMKVLASAMVDFAGMSWTGIGKGLAAVAGGLVIIAGASKLMPPGMVGMGLGLIAVSLGLKVIAGVVEKFSGMDWRSIAKGLAAIGGALVIIGGAMQLMPSNMAITGAGLLLVSVALGKIASAVESMGGMSIKEIAKGLGTLAGSLTILAVALYAMSGSLAGAAALGIAAAGIALLAPALVAMGNMSWGSILKGLVTLGAALTVLGVAGVLLAPTIPALLGLGAALVLIGGGLALAGAGIFLISTGLSALVVAAPTGVGVIVQAFVDLQKGVIENAKLLILGLLEIVKQFAAVAPQFVDALVKILNSLLDVIIQASPKIREAFDTLMTLALNVLRDNQPKIVQAGFNLIIALLTGIKNNIPTLITLIVDIITRILSTIASNLGRIITAGMSVLTSLVKGILSQIGTVVTTALEIINRFIGAIANNLGKIVTAGLSILTGLLRGIANNLGNVIRAATDVVVAFINGVGNAGSRIIAAGTNTIIKFINAIQQNSNKLINAGMRAIVNFLNGVAAAINANAGAMRAAGMNVGIAIIDGMTGGLLSKAGSLYSSIESVVGKAMSLMHSIPGVKSPSTVTTRIGEEIINGLANGITQNAPKAYSAAEEVSRQVTWKIGPKYAAMVEIGKMVGGSFAQGLRGSAADIKNAFKEMNAKLLEEMASARQTIAEEQKKLRDMRASGKIDSDEMKKINAIIAENENVLARASAGHKVLIKTLADEKSELMKVSTQYQQVSDKLKDAQKALEDAKQTRDDAIKSYTEQFDKLPGISATMADDIAAANKRISDAQAELSQVLADSSDDLEKVANARQQVADAEAARNKMLEGLVLDSSGTQVDQLATYMKNLQQQAEAVEKYKATLDQLRALGLDDDTYKKLLEEGTADQAFADQLLSGGKTAVDSLNTLDKQLDDVSKQLGTNAGNNLYQAGVDAATGLVEGLKSKKGELYDTMVELAQAIVETLKKSLKIKSPSEVFAEIGKLSMAGMAKGFEDSSKLVTDAVGQAADDALTAMKDSMRNISDIVTNELNPNPVITPVLDLTQVRAQAGELGDLTRVSPITAASSYGQASIISSEQNATAQTEQAAANTGGMSVQFEQNNYSPEALTEIEIYRQTKNQLSQLKSALALS